MAIRYIQYQDIDFQKWDALVEQAHNGLPYAYSWFLDSVAEEWDTLVLGDYEAIMPLPFNRKLPFTLQIYQPHFAQQLGIFSRKALSEAEVLQMRDTIPAHFKRVDYLFNHACQVDGFSTKNNLILDLNQDYETTFKSYASTLRNELRKAKKAHQFVESPLSPSQLIARYKSEQGHKVAYDSYSYKNLATLIDTAIRQQKGFIAGATDSEGQLRAVGFFLHSHNRIINLLATSDQAARKLKCEYIFDFEGSNVPSIAKFFSRFGASAQPYYHYQTERLPKWLQVALWAKNKISG